MVKPPGFASHVGFTKGFFMAKCGNIVFHLIQGTQILCLQRQVQTILYGLWNQETNFVFHMDLTLTRLSRISSMHSQPKSGHTHKTNSYAYGPNGSTHINKTYVCTPEVWTIWPPATSCSSLNRSLRSRSMAFFTSLDESPKRESLGGRRSCATCPCPKDQEWKALLKHPPTLINI